MGAGHAHFERGYERMIRARLPILQLLGRPKRIFRSVVQRRRLGASIRESDRFIVGYPKSGSTWVSFFMAGVIADRRGVQWDPLDFNFQYQFVPDVNGLVRRGSLREYAQFPDPRVFRCHSEFNPILPKVVYLVRDPRDVTVSYYHHRRRLDPEFRTPIDRFASAQRLWREDWGAHVLGWLEGAVSDRCLFVRYEDLKRDPETHLGAIAAFSGYPLKRGEAKRFVELSSFERMQKSVERVEKAQGMTIRFVRRGKVGGWQDELCIQSARHIEERYAELMTRLGYLPQADGFDHGSRSGLAFTRS